jgi:hypothetical protein
MLVTIIKYFNIGMTHFIYWILCCDIDNFSSYNTQIIIIKYFD